MKTLAQTLGALLLADGTGLLNTAWTNDLSTAGMATALSVLTSVASGAIPGPPSRRLSHPRCSPRRRRPLMCTEVRQVTGRT
ncbi:MAG: holin [Frankiaceae bacterium]